MNWLKSLLYKALSRAIQMTPALIKCNRLYKLQIIDFIRKYKLHRLHKRALTAYCQIVDVTLM